MFGFITNLFELIFNFYPFSINYYSHLFIYRKFIYFIQLKYLKHCLNFDRG